MADSEEHFSPSVRLCELTRPESRNCGFHLSRTKWDPYPWVSVVDDGSAAQHAGLQVGDCLLEVNGEDVLGQRIGEIATRVRARSDKASLLVWTSGAEKDCDPEALCCGPMPSSLQRLSSCLGSILGALECPVCLDTIAPPAHQCGNGHLICLGCRARAERCPVCRVRLSRGRSLLADQVYNALTDAFNVRGDGDASSEQQSAKLRMRLLGSSKKNTRSSTEPNEPPELKVSFSAPAANKFLARLMGKSSSLNNLASLAEDPEPGVRLSAVPRHLSPGTQLKVKSLSTSEISRPASPSGAVQRWGSGLLDATDIPIGSSQRPASMENLVALPDLESERARLSEFRCPWSPTCQLLLPRERLVAHGRSHGGPLLLSFRSQCALPLPLGAPLCLSLSAPPREFFVNTQRARDGHSYIRAWMAASPSECSNWKLHVTVHHSGGSTRTTAAICSLSTDVHDQRESISLDDDGEDVSIDELEMDWIRLPSHAHGVELHVAVTNAADFGSSKCGAAAGAAILQSLQRGGTGKETWR